jgi:2-keto-4-pentenoate hydratase/2-oxohepta-3-ene-1,7-dioic acid hydratase in catechol pathway
MKLLRVGAAGRERPAMIDSRGRLRDRSGHLADIAGPAGRRYQHGSTRTMTFDVPTLVSCISQFTSLQPGDAVCAGRPAGVGMGRKPDPVCLKAGQEIRLGITGLGEQRQRTIHANVGAAR